MYYVESDVKHHNQTCIVLSFIFLTANQPLQQNGVINGGNKAPPPQLAPKPNRSEKRNTVDNLLDQLENVLPDGPRRK